MPPWSAPEAAAPPAPPTRRHAEGSAIEYRITLPPTISIREHPASLEAALLKADPAAILDLDPAHVVRVATALGTADLTALLRAHGGPFSDAEVEVLPSICCGGCSG